MGGAGLGKREQKKTNKGVLEPGPLIDRGPTSTCISRATPRTGESADGTGWHSFLLMTCSLLHLVLLYICIFIFSCKTRRSDRSLGPSEMLRRAWRAGGFGVVDLDASRDCVWPGHGGEKRRRREEDEERRGGGEKRKGVSASATRTTTTRDRPSQSRGARTCTCDGLGRNDNLGTSRRSLTSRRLALSKLEIALLPLMRPVSKQVKRLGSLLPGVAGKVHDKCVRNGPGRNRAERKKIGWPAEKPRWRRGDGKETEG